MRSAGPARDCIRVGGIPLQPAPDAVKVSAALRVAFGLTAIVDPDGDTFITEVLPCR
jgi:hypothetical protein